MNSTRTEEDVELARLLRVPNKEGHTALTIGLLITVFFDNQLSREKRVAVTEVAEEYIELVRDHLRWAISPKGKRENPIGSARVKSPRTWLPDHPEGKGWEFLFHSGESAKATGEFQLEAYGSKYPELGMGFLHMSFPLLWFAERSFTLPEYLLGVCKRVRPLSGYAGIGVIEPLDGYVQDEFQPIVREFAERFPGLEIENRVGHTIHLRTGIKGVNWLTVLGDRWVESLGGLKQISAQLDDSFGFYPYEGGVIIQAGSKPQIGDVQADLWPEHYIKLAKVLKKVQIKDHYDFHFGGPNRMDHELTMKWLFRFDNK
jgi:hypothetical protein